MAASSSHATDISEPSEGDTYEIPDPNDEHDPFIQEEHDQLWQAAQDMDQHAWSPEQLNYIADQVHYSNSQNDYFGRNEDYDPNADEFDYFTLEPDSLNDLVDAPAIFDDDNYLMLSKDLKSKNISARTPSLSVILVHLASTFSSRTRTSASPESASLTLPLFVRLATLSIRMKPLSRSFCLNVRQTQFGHFSHLV